MQLESYEPSEPSNRVLTLSDTRREQRRQIRLRLAGPVLARIHIVRIGDVRPALPPAPVELVDLSPGGCSFRTGLRFPVRDDAVYRMEWQLEGIAMKIKGQLVWRSEDEYGFRYGVRFAFGAVETILLVRLLNALILKACPHQSRIHRLYRSQLDNELRR
ncbi:PilZ domain-containing protein [Cohnella rhizosphaerae]|uniref:PilZ domain-containing protein n=1 Tax=Cohnella rhizosphaerae TaxID=1457232 RepID=A0A9X4L1E8_9BACL|nr:PilZ domain-containing protein [Cohnella rhizosphaerae]MDG0814433.1 PilZ domain-containing protein [Cohnella rhizosphaerae]